MLVNMVNVLKIALLKRERVGRENVSLLFFFFFLQGGFKTMGSREKIENAMCWQVIEVMLKI